MTWILSIEHTSRYRYTQPSNDSFNEAKMLPQSDRSQFVLERTLTITPPAHVLAYQDYWGTLTHIFEVHQPHHELSVVARSRVQTGIVPPILNDQPSWAHYQDPQFDDQFAEFLDPTDKTKIEANEELDEVLEALRASPTPRDAITAASEVVHSRLTYEVGSTAVSTSASEAWGIHKGVCQDFAHLCIGLLRKIGIPARYVSGYYYPERDESIGQLIDAESHAWVEAWSGSWLPLDPTNGGWEAERYVIIGRGRDYTDVPPLMGIYNGAGVSEMEVHVGVTRES